MQRRGQDLSANFHLFVISLGFGSAMLFTHITVAALPILWVAFGRAVIAMVALGILVAVGGGMHHLKWSYAPHYILLGFLTGAVPYFALAWSQRYIASSLGGVIFAASPLLVMLMGSAFFGETRPGLKQLVAAIAGLGGVAFALPVGVDHDGAEIWGSLATLLAAASYALGALCIQRMKLPGMLAVSFAQLIPASLILAVAALLFGGPLPVGIGVEPILYLTALGTLSTALPLVSFYALVPLKGAAFASLSTFFIPFVAVGLGILMLGEKLSVSAIAGFMAAVAGSYFISQRPDRVEK